MAVCSLHVVGEKISSSMNLFGRDGAVIKDRLLTVKTINLFYFDYLVSMKLTARLKEFFGRKTKLRADRKQPTPN